jgi:hypothetical protein
MLISARARRREVNTHAVHILCEAICWGFDSLVEGLVGNVPRVLWGLPQVAVHLLGGRLEGIRELGLESIEPLVRITVRCRDDGEDSGINGRSDSSGRTVRGVRDRGTGLVGPLSVRRSGKSSVDCLETGRYERNGEHTGGEGDWRWCGLRICGHIIFNG